MPFPVCLSSRLAVKGKLHASTDADHMPSSVLSETECHSRVQQQHFSGSNPPTSKSPIMADVANSLSASTPTAADSGQIIAPESPDSVLLSPGVKEAMDRIFPCSASQLLTRRLSFEEDPIIGSRNSDPIKDKLPSLVEAAPKSATNPTSSVPYTLSATPVATAMESALTAGFRANGSQVVRLPKVGPTDSPPITPGNNSNERDREPESQPKVQMKEQSPERLKLTKLRISKADMEIINSFEAFGNEPQERISKKRRNSVEVSSSECFSMAESDPEDMRKPFANAVKEKKKHKKKKKKAAGPTSSLLLENSINSEEEFKSIKHTDRKNASSSPVSEWNASDSVSLKKIFSKSKDSQKSLSLKLPVEANEGNFYTASPGVFVNSHESLSHNSIVENGSVSQDTFYREDEMTTEEFSNLSFSSSKENEGKKRSRQKLPVTKRTYFHVKKDRKGIRCLFPPCFVVIKKLDTPPSVYCFSKSTYVIDNILPLSARMKSLSEICAKGSIDCRERKDVKLQETMYKNIFEETVLPGNSDDEFEKSRGGRSLRKRDKNISYVEPSEDDILDEFSCKRARKQKEAIGSKSEEESLAESKKKKQEMSDIEEENTSDKTEKSASDKTEKSTSDKKEKSTSDKTEKSTSDKTEKSTSDKTEKSTSDKTEKSTSDKTEKSTSDRTDQIRTVKDKTDNSDKSMAEVFEVKRKKKKKTAVNANNTAPSEAKALESSDVASRTSGDKIEIVVYPRTNPNEPSPYHVRKDGRDKLAAKLIEKSKSLPKTAEKGKTSGPEMPSVTRISILPSSTLSGSLPIPTPGTTMFPSLPVSFPVGLHPPPPLVAGVTGTVLPTPLSSALAAPSKPPQYCMVKMDGKDVLLQLVPSGAIGAPVPLPGMQAVLLSGGKRLVVPPAVPLVSSTSQLLSHPVQPNLSVTNVTQSVSVSLPLSSVSTAGQGTTSTASLQSILGIPVISRSHQTARTSAPNFSLSALPVISSAQLAGLTSVAGIRPITLPSSVPLTAPGSVTVTTAPKTVLTSTVTGTVPTAIRTIAPATATATSALSALAPMAAPITTTVVRSVRVPGTSLRAIVPNQSTGIHSVRIFVPGCSATGTAGHFATLGSVASSSPLTRLSANSELLPQRKQSTDQTLTPEQRAAKRRKLEKKYPLPPGVIIKTEPLDSPSSPSTSAASKARSLLAQNIQLLSSTARPGYSIRIIRPSALGTNVKGNSNVIYRAASVGGRQTILVPTTLGLLTTTRTATTTATVTVSSLSTTTTAASVATASTTAVQPVVAPTSGVDTSIIVTESGTDSLVRAVDGSPTTSVVLSTITESATAAATNIPTSCTSTASSTVLTAVVASSTPPRISTGDLSPVSQSVNTNTNNNSFTYAKDLPTSKSATNSPPISMPASSVVQTEDTSLNLASNLTFQSEAILSSPASVTTNLITTYSDKSNLSPVPCNTFNVGRIENLKVGLESLRKFIQTQEAMGLKGERLDKLKDLLRKKEAQLHESSMISLSETVDSAEPSAILETASSNSKESVNNQQAATEVNDPGGTETDPFVID